MIDFDFGLLDIYPGNASLKHFPLFAKKLALCLLEPFFFVILHLYQTYNQISSHYQVHFKNSMMNDIFKTGSEEVKMIDFVGYLYKKHKILNKLNEKQSRDFQTEIVNLLVDANQNVDRQTLDEINSNIGFQTFLLQILGNIVNHNPFKNQYELNRNLDTIAEKIKKDQEDLQKRLKMVQRKQEKIKITEEQLLNVFKQKISVLQAESLKKISAKEVQIKRSISALLNQLKGKEKLILQRYQTIKSNRSVLSQLSEKEKVLSDKIKYIQKKERELKNNNFQKSIFKKDSQLIEVQDQNGKLKENIKQLNSKIKNLQLAYRKVKLQNEKLMNEKQNNLKSNDKGGDKVKDYLSLELDQLGLSMIETQPKGANIKKNKENVLNQQQKLNIRDLLDHGEEEEEEDDRKVQMQEKQEEYSENLSFLGCRSDSDPYDNISKQINSIDLQSASSKEKFIKSGLLMDLFQKVDSLRYPETLSCDLLEMMLPLMEMDEAHQTISSYLSQSAIVNYLQKIYLCHQTSSDIAQSSTLILSRVKLWTESMELNPQFRKSIEIRRRVEPEKTILCMNIKYLLV